MTTEEKARAYAEKKTKYFVPEHYGSMKTRRRVERFDSYDIEQAYEDGATDALASQWVSVEERLPEIGELVVAAYIGFVTATYDGEDWYDANDHLIRPTHWLPIPPLKGGGA